MFSKTTYAKMVSGMSKEQVEGLVNNISRHTLGNAKAFIAEKNVEYTVSRTESIKQAPNDTREYIEQSYAECVTSRK